MSRYCNPDIDDGEEWETTMPGCCCHVRLCCCATFCPCVVFGRTAKAVDEPPYCCGFLWLLSFVSCYAHFRIRGKLRAKYNINGKWGGDCWRTYLCGPCSLAQEMKEVEDREPDQPAPEVSYKHEKETEIVTEDL